MFVVGSTECGHCLWHGLSKDLETGCPKLAILKFWGVQIFKGDHNILRFQPLTGTNSLKQGMISLYNAMRIIWR